MTAGQSQAKPVRRSTRAATPSADEGRGTSAPREYFFDNAKFLALVFVVIAHAWEPLLENSRTTRALYMVIYAFHMPAFIVISGYFSRSFDYRAGRLQRLITGIVVPYLVFETAYSLFKRFFGGDWDHPVSLLDPWYLTWFLVALCIWRLSAPLWRILRWPVPLALAVASLAATSTMSDDLDLQRVLQFLPFFVLGLVLEPRHFSLVRSWNARLLAIPVFAVALVFAYWATPRMTLDWFYHRAGAEELGVSASVSVVMTLALFVCSLVLVAGFFSWVPGRRLWITGMGSTTLYVYLLHGFVMKSAEYGGWYGNEFVHTPLGGITVTLISAVVAFFLGTPLIKAVFRPVMEPKMDWAFRRSPRERPGGQVG